MWIRSKTMYLATYMELLYMHGYVEEINEMIDYGSTTKNYEIPTATHCY